MSKPVIVIFYLFLAAVWGASFMFLRVGVPEFGAYPFTGLRVGIAGLALLPFLLQKKRRGEIKENWLRLTLIGFLSTGVPFTLYSFALTSLNAGIGSVINASVPMMTGVLAHIFFQEKLTAKQWLGLFIGLAGVSVLMADGLANGIGDLSAFFIALCACLFYAIGSNLTKRYLSHISSMTTAASGLVASGLIMLPLTIALFPSTPISNNAILSALGISLLSTAVAMVMFYSLIKALGPTKTVTLTLVIPVFGFFWGIVLLGEPFTRQMAIGSVIILCGTALSIFDKAK